MRREGRHHARGLHRFGCLAVLVVLHGSPAWGEAGSELQAVTPEGTYRALVSAVAANDGASVWSMLSQESHIQ